jgi:hypothetical protein
MSLILLASAQVINLWGYALNYSNHHQKSSIVGIGMIIVNFLATVASLCYICKPRLFFPISPSLLSCQWSLIKMAHPQIDPKLLDS